MPRVSRARARDGIALLAYTAVSFAFFGWRLVPHPGRDAIGFGHDHEIYVWSFAWWEHALLHGHNPFYTHSLYAPTGIDLAWTLSVPGLALVLVPLTALAGPVVSYNVAAVLLPALCAWTAYLLCRYLTGSTWAAGVGGYLFGFSAAILPQQVYGHLPVTGIFLLPLVALAVVRYVRAQLDGRGLAWRLGVLLAAQLWLSTEFALTLTLVLALGLLLGFWLLRDARPRIVSSLLPIVAGYGLGALFAAPLVYYTLRGFLGYSFEGVNDSVGTDLLNYVIPTRVIALGGTTFWPLARHFTPAGASGYLGLPTLAIVVLFALRVRRSAGARFLVAALAVTVVMALGTSLLVDGHRVIPLPWSLAVHLPVLANALPFRLAAYVSLVAAVIVAMWTASAKGLLYPRPYVLPALAVVALVPAVWRTTYPTFRPVAQERWPFFTEGLYRSCLEPGETVAIFPFGAAGDSMLWQAETGFRFRLAADGLQAPPKYAKALTTFDDNQVVRDLVFVDYAHPTMDRLLAFAAVNRVDRVISVAADGYPSAAQMRAFGPVERIGGVLVAPACGRPSLATRDLSAYVARYRAQLVSRPNIGWCIGTNFNLLPQGLTPAGVLAGAKRAIFVDGTGLTCPPAPEGYVRRGFATENVPPNTYAFYVRE
jgi:hypothetical protein